MYKVMVTPPIVYVKVEDNLTSASLAQVCESLLSQHDELDGDYDSIYIDFAAQFEVDFNFKNSTRSFLQLIKQEKKHLFILNPTDKTTKGIERQGLSSLMKVKNLDLATMAASKPKDEFRVNESGQIEGQRIAYMLDKFADEVFPGLGCNATLATVPVTVPAEDGEVYSICEMVDNGSSVLVGLRFRQKPIIAALIKKLSGSTEINLASMQRWTDEILNMFISKIATSQENQKWQLTKVGQPCPHTDARMQTLIKGVTTVTPKNYSELQIELVYQISPRADEPGKENANSWVKNPAA